MKKLKIGLLGVLHPTSLMWLLLGVAQLFLNQMKTYKFYGLFKKLAL